MNPENCKRQNGDAGRHGPRSRRLGRVGFERVSQLLCRRPKQSLRWSLSTLSDTQALAQVRCSSIQMVLPPQIYEAIASWCTASQRFRARDRVHIWRLRRYCRPLRSTQAGPTTCFRRELHAISTYRHYACCAPHSLRSGLLFTLGLAQTFLRGHDDQITCLRCSPLQF
jgi:hypothetical protein